AASKAANKRIVYVQMGRLFKDISTWEILLDTLAKMSVNFIFDVGRADYSTSKIKLYENFFSASFIPIGSIKEDIDFVICTSQTTSVLSAIIHGKQILGIPHSAHSIELSRRLESKNIAKVIYDSKDINIENMQD